MKSCCSNCGKCYLGLLNTILLLTGITLIGMSIWLAVEYKGYGSVISAAFVWLPLGAGVMMMMLALLGCCSALHEHPIALAFYVAFLSILLVLVLVLGSFLLVEIGDVSSAANTFDSATITNANEQQAVAFISVLYNRCCSSQQGSKYTVGPCPCTTQTPQGCLCYDEIRYNGMLQDFDQQVCTVMSDLTVTQNGIKTNIVGPIADGACGSGDPKLFAGQVSTYVSAELSPAAWAITACSGLFLAGILFASYMLCSKCPGCCKKRDVETYQGEYGEPDDLNLSKPIDLEDGDSGLEMSDTMRLA